MSQEPPLVAHILHRFDTGGLENGVVNLINHMPAGAYRHMVVSLTEVTEFRRRLNDPTVECIALHKPPGQGARLYPKLWQLLREHRPAIVHTRNLAALEMQPVAWAAGVPARIHGEHGRDLDDLDGASLRRRFIHRLYDPFVQNYVALSKDLATYFTARVGIAPRRVSQIYNGVDTRRFQAVPIERSVVLEARPDWAGCFVVGTVGRMHGIKHQTLLAQAFVRAVQTAPALRARLRLLMVGEGPLREDCQAILRAANLDACAWLPGERSDVPALLRELHAFVLPSLSEGVSNSILEAMASGLPVIATAVGGNPELIVHGETGLLVPANDVPALAQALCRVAEQPQEAARMGSAGRARVEERFSLQAMVRAYQGLYDNTRTWQFSAQR